MAFTQSDLDAINEAIASGALEVRYQDKLTRYRGIDDLLKAKAVIEDELAAAVPAGTTIAPRQNRFITNRGTQP